MPPQLPPVVPPGFALQAPLTQYGVPACPLQSALSTQGSQLVCELPSTHVALHSPAWQPKPPVQSAEVRHCAQPLPKQYGVEPPQSLF